MRPRVRTDLNSSSLANQWTREDLDRQGIELRDGMQCVFYDLDAEDGQNGFLHCEGTVWWDANSGVFRIGSSSDYPFTPGENISVLDGFYADDKTGSDESGI